MQKVNLLGQGFQKSEHHR